MTSLLVVMTSLQVTKSDMTSFPVVMTSLLVMVRSVPIAADDMTSFPVTTSDMTSFQLMLTSLTVATSDMMPFPVVITSLAVDKTSCNDVLTPKDWFMDVFQSTYIIFGSFPATSGFDDVISGYNAHFRNLVGW